MVGGAERVREGGRESGERALYIHKDLFHFQ